MKTSEIHNASASMLDGRSSHSLFGLLLGPGSVQKKATESQHEDNRFRDEEPYTFGHGAIGRDAKKAHYDRGRHHRGDKADSGAQPARGQQAREGEYRERE